MGSSPRLWLGTDGAERAPKGMLAPQSPLQRRPTTAGSPKEGMDGAWLQAQPWEAQSCSPLPRLPDRRHVASEPPPPPAQPFPLACLPQTHWPPPPELWTPRPWEELLGAVPGTEGSGRLTAPPKAESRKPKAGSAGSAELPGVPHPGWLAISVDRGGPSLCAPARPPTALGGPLP